MQIPVLVEPVANNGFRARPREPLPVSAEGATPEEAVRNLRAATDRQLKNGKQLQWLDLAPENPWLALAGMHDPNDPRRSGAPAAPAPGWTSARRGSCSSCRRG